MDLALPVCPEDSGSPIEHGSKVAPFPTIEAIVAMAKTALRMNSSASPPPR